ncbi:MAG: sigma-54 dependent transcriptional regulator, partial [Nitrospirota bacterium]|nr:sigma-54 dependent transcriptional regulator [Nitrospirota bacterium]
EFILNKQKLEVLEEQTKTQVNFEQLVGKSAVMQEVFRRLRLAAKSEVSILLTGESGTGKELAARAIHSLSCRKDHPFLAINCSAIPDTLLESELFGHVKGSFTGAARDKIGIFQAAEGGTLFLDEIGDTSPLLQLKLLRVLQEKEIRRVGEEKNIKVNVRLITATNRVIKDQIKSGEMREDFYYRIRVFEIELPPLRERRDDIPLLVNHFIAEGKKVHHREVNGITKDAMHRLMDYSWPGNVRELKNAFEHAFVTVNDNLITAFDLPPEVRNPQQSQPNGEAGLSVTGEAALERQHILDALRQTGGHRGRAQPRS